jgi:hypothetical protein
MASANHATQRNGRTRTAVKDGITGPHTENSARTVRAGPRQRLAATAKSQPSRFTQKRSLLLPKEHPHPGPSRSGAQAQEYGRTERNLRGFSRTGGLVTTPPATRGLNKSHWQGHWLSHEPAPSRLKGFRGFRKTGRLAASQ